MPNAKDRAGMRRALKRIRKSVPPGAYKATGVKTEFDRLTGNVRVSFRIKGKGLGPGGRKQEFTMYSVQPPLTVEKVPEPYAVTAELVRDDKRTEFIQPSASAVRTLERPSYEIGEQANQLVVASIRAMKDWQQGVEDLTSMDERHEDYVAKLADVGAKFQQYLAATRLFRMHVATNGDLSAL